MASSYAVGGANPAWARAREQRLNPFGGRGHAECAGKPGAGCSTDGLDGADRGPYQRPQQCGDRRLDGAARRKHSRRIECKRRPIPDGGRGLRVLRFPDPDRPSKQCIGDGAGTIPVRRLLAPVTAVDACGLCCCFACHSAFLADEQRLIQRAHQVALVQTADFIRDLYQVLVRIVEIDAHQPGTRACALARSFDDRDAFRRQMIGDLCYRCCCNETEIG